MTEATYNGMQQFFEVEKPQLFIGEQIKVVLKELT
jgi:hypothetical protein